MDIDTLLRDLGSVDAARLSDAILGQDDEAWREDQNRQQVFDVHRETESIVLVFVNLEHWPEIEIVKQPGWDRLADVAIPLMHDIIDKHYPKGGTIVRAMAAKLLSGGKIRPHIDTHPSFHIGHRIHVPITTNPRVRFMIDGRPHRLEVGRAYEINNQKNHSVMNKGAEDRITFIFDYIPPEQLAKLGKRRKKATASA
ncbi:MAG: aspartyl/asparaginyl beta-hydroxylase domain-containing protein [Woeseiaceae bacterium]